MVLPDRFGRSPFSRGKLASKCSGSPGQIWEVSILKRYVVEQM